MRHTSWNLVIGCGFAIGCATAVPDQPVSIDAPKSIDAVIDVGVDAAAACATDPCDILGACGCAAGMTCDLDRSDVMGTACRAITTPGQEVNTCASPNSCDSGYVCLNGANNGQGFCKKYCDADSDCVAPGGKCVLDITSGGVPIAGIPSVCTSNCDPTAVGTGVCPAAHKCGIFSVTHAGVTQNIADCAGAGVLVQGGNCKSGTAGLDALCAPDFMCTTINGGTNFNCRRICDRGNGNADCGALSCLAFNPVLTIGVVEYGVCN